MPTHTQVYTRAQTRARTCPFTQPVLTHVHATQCLKPTRARRSVATSPSLAALADSTAASAQHPHPQQHPQPPPQQLGPDIWPTHPSPLASARRRSVHFHPGTSSSSGPGTTGGCASMSTDVGELWAGKPHHHPPHREAATAMSRGPFSSSGPLQVRLRTRGCLLAIAPSLPLFALACCCLPSVRLTHGTHPWQRGLLHHKAESAFAQGRVRCAAHNVWMGRWVGQPPCLAGAWHCRMLSVYCGAVGGRMHPPAHACVRTCLPCQFTSAAACASTTVPWAWRHVQGARPVMTHTCTPPTPPPHTKSTRTHKEHTHAHTPPSACLPACTRTHACAAHLARAGAAAPEAHDILQGPAAAAAAAGRLPWLWGCPGAA